MAEVFHLNIVTSEKKLYDGAVTSLIAPGELGYLGVLANHAPLLTTLAAGTITAREASGKELRFETKTSGFLEVLHNKATILID